MGLYYKWSCQKDCEFSLIILVVFKNCWMGNAKLAFLVVVGIPHFVGSIDLISSRCTDVGGLVDHFQLLVHLVVFAAAGLVFVGNCCKSDLEFNSSRFRC